MANMLGMLIGAAIDRRDGDSGIKGAVIGALVQGALRVATPIAVTVALGLGVRYAARRAYRAVTERDRDAADAAGPAAAIG
jgi:hypothetical protein